MTPEVESMNARRLGWLALAAIVIFWMVKDPAGAGQAFHAIVGFFSQAASSFGTLMGSL